MATTTDMVARSTAMTGRFCWAERQPFWTAFPSEEREDGSGLKGFPAPAGLLGVGIGDAETGSGQSILVIDDRAGEVNQPAILDKEFHAVRGKFLVARLSGGN